jgi:hypothetical protein
MLKKDVRIDNQNRVIWNLALNAGESRKLILKYQIEFPSDSEVQGLE